jgi:phosphocarrier protein FPr
VDGFSGRLWIDPPADIVENLAEKRRHWLTQRQRRRDVGRQPAVTADGQHVRVAANAGSAAEARAATKNGAGGIGLLRTEFIYLSSPEPADEETQVAMLQRIGAVMGNQPVCVRTLDAGGDKPLSFLSTATEDNPFLGVRGVRLSLAHPDLLHAQLRAVLRAAATWRLKLMVPMISTVEEVESVRKEWMRPAVNWKKKTSTTAGHCRWAS